MKTAIYVEDGLIQFVLTPETQIDKQVLEQIAKAKGLSTHRGSFYENRGGWIRYREAQEYGHYGVDTDNSLIFVVREEIETQPQMAQP